MIYAVIGLVLSNVAYLAWALHLRRKTGWRRNWRIITAAQNVCSELQRYADANEDEGLWALTVSLGNALSGRKLERYQ